MNATEESSGRLVSIGVAFGLMVFGVLVAELMTTPVVLVDPAIIEDPASVSRELAIAFFALNFTGFFVAGAAYLRYTDRGWDWVDLRVPTRRDWVYVAIGLGGAILAIVVVSLVSAALGVEGTSNQIVEFVLEDTTLLFVLIVMVFLFNAPAEEFLFRNVIQKRLYAAFSRMGAILVTSTLFALIHIPTYLVTAEATGTEAALSTGVSILVIFVGSVVFGYVYAKTDNLVVPTLAHAFYNALQFLNLYVLIEYFPEELEAMAVFWV